jgi:hypothetical protein
MNWLNISRASGIQSYPDVAFGGNYMVVWSDRRAGSYYNLYAARVTPGGTVLDPNGIVAGTSGTLNHYFPTIAFDGTRYLAVWNDWGLNALTGRFINTNGSLGDTVRVATGASSIYYLNVAFDGTNYLVLWTEHISGGNYDLKGQLVSPSGSLIGTAFTIANNVYYYYSIGVTFDGTNYFVTYISRDTGTYQVYGRNVSTAGVPLGFPFRISNSNSTCYYCDVATGTDDHYFTVWSQYTTTYDIYGNVDLVIGAEEKDQHKVSKISIRSTVVRNAIHLSGAEGTMVSVYDVSGRLVGTTRSGIFNCKSLAEGAYLVKTSTGEQFKVVKIK